MASKKRLDRLPGLLFIMQLPPPVHGVSVMSKLIYDSKLVNETFDCHYINLSTSRSIRDLQQQKLYKWFLAFKLFCETFYCLISRRYKKVYVTVFPYGPGFIKDALIVMLAKLFRQKVVIHLHSYGFRQYGQKSPLKAALYRMVFRKTRPICLSPLLVEDIAPFYSGTIDILPNGVPAVNFQNNYKVGKSEISLLYFSNLIRGKGIFIIIEAMAELVKRGYHLVLTIAGPEGDVTYDELKQELSRRRIDEYVKLIGPVFDEKKYGLYHDADLFLLPSDYDTFGLVILDAMQFGVPVISSPIGGIPDVLGNGRGRLLERIDAESLITAIEELILNDQQRERISQLSFEYFHKNYTTEVFERKLIQILNDEPDQSVHLP